MTRPLFKTRFAPSPTGRLHLGNVRTALFNWLLARREDGIFLLRFEDTDLERSAAEYEPGMQEDLLWLSLGWQEGPGAGGDSGPYRQSERGEIYERYFVELERAGLAYPCYCSQEELSVARKAQLAAGQPPRYPGTCARLSEEERAARQARGLRPTLRFRVPADGGIEFEDMVRGPQRFEARDIGDFILRRSDGTPAFFFSNAVDDALMGITHVLRGEDHLANTPRQIMILESLGLPVPRYGHTAMIVGPDGSPLSKRHGARSVRDLREEGFFPGAVLNYLARLGHSYERDEWLDQDELAADFSLERLGRSAARYEDTQLLYWQKQAVKRCSDETLWSWMETKASSEGQSLQDLVPDGKEIAFVQAVRDNIDLPVDALVWGQNLFSEHPHRSDEARRAIHEAGPEFFRVALKLLEDGGDDFKSYASSVGQGAGVKGKGLYMPLRAAITGQVHGPEMANIWKLLETGQRRGRLEAAAALAAG